MKFIIEPQKEDRQYSVPPVCKLLPVTTCALCSEDPRFCPPPYGPGPNKP